MSNLIGEANEVDWFRLETYAEDYERAAFDGNGSVHPHDAFELAVRHSLTPEQSKLACFFASNRVREAARINPYLPYEPLPEGWVDELE